MCSRCALLPLRLVWGESINSVLVNPGQRDYLSQWACRESFPRRVLPWWQRDASHALSGACGANLQPHKRHRWLPQQTHRNLHVFKRTFSYRLFAPRMALNSLWDSGKTSLPAEINIQFQQGDGVSWGEVYKQVDRNPVPKQPEVQRLMPRRMFIVLSNGKQVLLIVGRKYIVILSEVHNSMDDVILPFKLEPIGFHNILAH